MTEIPRKPSAPILICWPLHWLALAPVLKVVSNPIHTTNFGQSRRALSFRHWRGPARFSSSHDLTTIIRFNTRNDVVIES
jgi:hypothetical protein